MPLNRPMTVIDNWPPLGGNPNGARSIKYGDIIHDQDNSGSASRKNLAVHCRRGDRGHSGGGATCGGSASGRAVW
jgi:hypothetical protein